MDIDVATARHENETTLQDCDRSELASFVLWLLEEQSVTPSEVARMIEKPLAYGDWFAVYRDRGSLDMTLAGLSSTRLTVLP